MISVIAVDYHGGIFREILEDSLKRHAHPDVPYELLIHDNGRDENIGHAKGLDKLVREAHHNIILALDIDSHILLPGWNTELEALHDEEWKNGVRLIAGQGGQLKPVRPCVAMFERDYFLENKLTFEPHELKGAKFDVGILMYFQVLSKAGGVKLFPSAKKSYPNTIGNDYAMPDGRPLVFHHWYGTRWYNGRGEVARDQIDGVRRDDFVKSRDEMFKQYKAKYE